MSNTSNSQVTSHHKHRDIDAAEQINEVIVGLGQFEISSLQLLVCALQLFVARQNLLIGSLEFLVAGLFVLDQGVQIPFGGNKFLLQVAALTITAFFLSSFARFCLSGHGSR